MKCNLIIKDEVNVKLEGLDLTLRKHLHNKFKYEIPGARYQPSVRLGRWDGKVGFFNLGGTTFINLLPDILPLLDQHGYDVDVDDQRDYSTTFQFTEIKEDFFADKQWPEGHPKQGEPIMLRDYQLPILNNFFTNPQSIQEVATGAGKTIMTAALSASVQKYGRSIVIVPNKSLVTQTLADYINVGLDVGVYFGDRKDYNKQHTICTWQSLNNLLKDTKNGEASCSIDEFIDDVVCVIVDEAHMAKADALKMLLSSVFARVPIRWGLTGTIPKEEYAFMALKCCIGDVVGKLSANELQEAGHLAQCHVNILQLEDYVEYKTYQQELKYLLENQERLSYISKLVEDIRQKGNTLILVDRVAPGKELTKLIDDAVFVSGSTKAANRKEEYDQVATSDKKVIVATYGVAAVGINIPRIFNLVLVEPGKSFVRVIQSIGRGIRKAQDKDHVEIWDITSTCKFAKRHLTARKKFYSEAQYPFTIKKERWQLK
jgi:superfamily II DNA or RNA helicase